jgi:hypothetical protein
MTLGKCWKCKKRYTCADKLLVGEEGKGVKMNNYSMYISCTVTPFCSHRHVIPAGIMRCRQASELC